MNTEVQLNGQGQVVRSEKQKYRILSSSLQPHYVRVRATGKFSIITYVCQCLKELTKCGNHLILIDCNVIHFDEQ